jgi:alpha-tubulin suppressor-like RCC1 family protein
MSSHRLAPRRSKRAHHTDRWPPLALALAALALISGGASASSARGDVAFFHTGIVDLWGGARAFIALRAGGSVWTWGWDDYGILGNGHGVTMFDTSTQYDELLPFQVLGAGGAGHLSSIVAIAGGERHNVALDANGEVWTWGWNACGQLGDGITCTPDAHSTDCMSSTPLKIANFGPVKAIASRGYHTLALEENGTLWAWGLNANGRLGDGTTIDRHYPVEIGGLDGHGGVLAISGGGVVNMALMADHTLMGWGENDLGAVGNGDNIDQHSPVPVSQSTGLTDVKAVSTGWGHVVALAGDGTVWTWGQNGDGELGDGKTAARNLPYHVPGITDVIAVSAGDAHTLILKKDGTAWGWGDNDYGQLGAGYSSPFSLVPVQVSGLGNIRAIRARNFNSFALASGGSVWGWGDNGRGVGDGTRGANKTTPVQVLFPEFWTEALFLPLMSR